MPQEKTKDEVKETGIVGIGIALLAASVNVIETEPYVGMTGVVVGFALLFLGIRFRNVRAGVTGEELMAAIRQTREISDEVVDELTGKE